LESPVSHKMNYTSAGEPSFFYLMMARGCFQRAGRAVHPNAGAVLRNIARDYLTKATKVTSVFESQSLANAGRPSRDREVG
jgi:hypothetical protein